MDNKSYIDGTQTSFNYTTNAEATAGLDATGLTQTTYGIVRANGANADMTISSFAAKAGDTMVVLQNPWQIIDFSNLTFSKINVADSGAVSLDVRNTDKVTVDAIDGSFNTISTASTAGITLNCDATATTITNNGTLTIGADADVTVTTLTQNGALTVNGAMTLATDGTYTIGTFDSSKVSSEQTTSGLIAGTYKLWDGTGTISGLTTDNTTLANATISAINGNEATITTAVYRVMNDETVTYSAVSEAGATGVAVDAGSTLDLVGAFSQNVANLKSFLSGVSGSGTVVYGGTVGGPLPLAEMAATGCTTKFSGVVGWINAGTSTNLDILLENRDNIAGLDINGANSGASYTFTGKLSGSGNMAYSQTDGRNASFILSGDLSGWTGNFTNANTATGVNLQFKNNANTTIANTVNNVATAGMFTVYFDNDNKLTVTGDFNNTGNGVINIALTENTAADFTGNVSDGSKVTLNSGATASFLDGTEERTITLSGLTVNGDSNLNANVVFTANATVTLAEGATVTMGSTIQLSDTTSFVIPTAVTADSSTWVTIADSVEGVKNAAGTSVTDAWTKSNGADKWYTGLTYDASTNTYSLGTSQGGLVLVYDLTDKSNGKLMVTPEPATATLSLLALAGLCARRRRH